MERTFLIRRVLLIVLGLNIAITIIKLIVGFSTGALSVIADGFHSLIDSSSNIVGLAGLWVASRPPDSNHPYGHHKYESIATLAIGGMLMLVSWEIVKGIFERFTSNTVLDISNIDIVIMASTFVVNLLVYLYESRQGRKLNSDLLLADASQTRTDLFITTSIVVSLIATRAGYAWVDTVVASVVVVLILRAAYTIIRRTSYILTDASVVEPNLIEHMAAGVPGVRFVHRARSRGTADAAYVDVHVKVDPAMSTAQAHAIATEVERKLLSDVSGVVDAVVHIEPAQAPAPSEWDAITTRARAEADAVGVGVHDLHIHEERSGKYSMEMHVEVPAHLSLGEAHTMVDGLESRVRTAIPRIAVITSHIEPIQVNVPGEEGPERFDTLAQRITSMTNEITGRHTTHDVQLHHVDGHLTATIHITLPATIPLTLAHAQAEDVERLLLDTLPQLRRVVVHVEPPE